MSQGNRLSRTSALLLIALGLAAGCDRGAAGAAAKAGAGAAAPREVALEAVSAVAFARTIFATGTLAADEQAVVGAGVAGRLARVRVDLGSPVRKGDAIADLETVDLELGVAQSAAALAYARSLAGLPPLEADGGADADDGRDIEASALVREARATLDEARANRERALSLGERGLATPAELDLARAAYLRSEGALQRAREEMHARRALVRQRRSELAIARRRLEEAVVRSPLDGAVAVRHVSAGEHVTVGAPVATIVCRDPLRLRLEVPERDAGGVRVGQPVRVAVDGDADGSASREGKVARISPVIGAQNRVLTVEVEVANPGGVLRPGGFARAEIVLDAEAPRPAVPEGAIVRFAGIEKVLTVEKGLVAERRIRTGRRQGDRLEVLSGLEAGAAVIASPGSLRHGQPVVATPTARGG